MKLSSNYIMVDQVNIHYVSNDPAGNAPKSTVFFLHGFPEFWQTWQQQLSYFSPSHRVIAPDLPGYNLSDKPEDTNFYQIPRLINFFAELIKSLCPNEKITLVAHDWGGAIAWPLVAFHPELFNNLVILNAAHPSTFTREMSNNAEQQRRSAYIHQLIATEASSLLSHNNFSYLEEKMRASYVNTVDKQRFEPYHLAWQQPGAINGMLQYYRAMPQLPPQINKHNSPTASAMKIPNIRINVPTLVLWGEEDQAFVNDNLIELENYVPQCTVIRFANTSHWLQHEKPHEINQAIERFLLGQ